MKKQISSEKKTPIGIGFTKASLKIIEAIMRPNETRTDVVNRLIKSANPEGFQSLMKLISSCNDSLNAVRILLDENFSIVISEFRKNLSENDIELFNSLVEKSFILEFSKTHKI